MSRLLRSGRDHGFEVGPRRRVLVACRAP